MNHHAPAAYNLAAHRCKRKTITIATFPIYPKAKTISDETKVFLTKTIPISVFRLDWTRLNRRSGFEMLYPHATLGEGGMGVSD